MRVSDKWLVKLQTRADASAGAGAFAGQKTHQSSSESRLDVTGGGGGEEPLLFLIAILPKAS